MDLKRNPYDEVAKDYDKISLKRARYNDSIDQIVVSLLSDYELLHIFDFGSGNGKRAKKLSEKLAAANLVLSDSSELMINECLKIENVVVVKITGTEIPLIEGKFQGILALWNVMGHVETSENRVQVLNALRLNLAKGGKLIFDVNNRYNGASYGYSRCLFRLLVDSVRFNPKRGDVEYSWFVNGQEVKSTGHVFTPKEIVSEINKSGFKVSKKFYVNYETGKVSKWFFKGQMMFSCEEDFGE
jgi:SAM-dependent methyltransferase